MSTAREVGREGVSSEETMVEQTKEPASAQGTDTAKRKELNSENDSQKCLHISAF